MTAIERAEALLAAAERCSDECTCTAPPPQPCGPHCEFPYPEERPPRCEQCTMQQVAETALPPRRELLRGYIAAVKALGVADEGLAPTAGTSGWPALRHAVDDALADFERLFPEETLASAD